MPKLRRVIAGALAYVIAALLSAAIVLVLLGSDAGDWQFYPVAALMVLAFAIIPFALAILVLHKSGQTGWQAHLAAGAVVSLAAQLVMSPGLLVRPAALFESWPIVAGGACAGFSYWWVDRVLMRLLRA